MVRERVNMVMVIVNGQPCHLKDIIGVVSIRPRGSAWEARGCDVVTCHLFSFWRHADKHTAVNQVTSLDHENEWSPTQALISCTACRGS
jgi:hypothetical protein